jgi:hypothetical protein
MAMDLVDCLNYILVRHGVRQPERSAVTAELQRRLPHAIDGAFDLRRFPELCAYRAMLATAPDLKMQVKCRIARLPGFIARLCADALSKRSAATAKVAMPIR